jgi:HPt (histidine-containing phosphotransfer) domain-containing protein
MNPESAMSDLPVIDSESIENLRSLNPGDGDEFLREIITIYLEDTPQRILELEESLAGGDTNRFSRAAHSVKGSSANLGAMAVRHVAELLEHQSNKHGLVEVTDLIAALKVQFDIAQAEFSKLLQPG